MFESLDNGWLFAGGAALGTLAASCWSHIRSAWQQVASRVVITVSVKGYAADAVQLYLKNRFRPSRLGPRAYLSWMLYVRPRRRVQLVAMEVAPPAGRLYWYGWRSIWLCPARQGSEGLNAGETTHDYTFDSLSLTFVRGTFDPDRLIAEATEWYNEQSINTLETGGRRHFIRYISGTAGHSHHGISNTFDHDDSRAPSSSTDIRSCLQYRPLSWSFNELGPETTERGHAFDPLALSDDALELIEEAQRWKASEQWYKSHNVPWRRGWLLHGPPGTGKTALARALADDLDLPVFIYDLATLNNEELFRSWSQMLHEVPCMALIEDIDAIFCQRRNTTGQEGQRLTFDCLLNCIDGVQSTDGLFLIVTSNHLDQIDPALAQPAGNGRSSRPGRIDRILELRPLDESGRRKLASRILDEWPGEWEPLVEEGTGDSGAQFQERCARRALELHYKSQSPQQSRDVRKEGKVLTA